MTAEWCPRSMLLSVDPMCKQVVFHAFHPGWLSQEAGVKREPTSLKDTDSESSQRYHCDSVESRSLIFLASDHCSRTGSLDDT